MPGRSIATSGAWPASTPKSPSVPGTIDLIDLAGEQELFGRDEIEVEGGHGRPILAYAASAASRLPFSTACSMVPTM